MKLNHIIPLVLILVVNIQLISGQNQSKVYDFPIKPGTAEWESFTTYEERLNAYNIPQGVLEVMNTADLVKSCINYPEFRLLMTRNSLQQGYDYLKSIFNGFRELEKRNDAGIELIMEYKKLDPGNIKNYNSLIEQGRFVFKFTYIEILLAQKSILSSLDNGSRKELIKICVSNFEKIEKMPDEYAIFGLITPALVLGRLLDIDGYQGYITRKSEDVNLSYFIKSSVLGFQNTLYEIINLSIAYLIQLEDG